jgi:glycyl-tRNA synthetase
MDMEKLVALCRRRGFIFQSSEIYGGINGFWDYGPLGVELKRNIKEVWWQDMVRNPPPGPDGQEISMVGVDCAIIMNPKVWEASGHVGGFADPMVMCKNCKGLFRSDQHYVVAFKRIPNGKTREDYAELYQQIVKQASSELKTAEKTFPAVAEVIRATVAKLQECKPDYAKTVAAGSAAEALELGVLSKKETKEFRDVQPLAVWTITDYFGFRFGSPPCPNCGDSMLTDPRPFNLMFESHAGAVQTEENKVYLRPETAQGIFVNFHNVLDSTRLKLPFGIAQVGKAFRNEINPRNYTFRSREFEQMEIEFFCHPEESTKWYQYWRDVRIRWYSQLGIKSEKLRPREQSAEERAHYSVGTTDIEYLFPFSDEPQELEGVAHRSDYDLKQHAQHSGKDLSYFDDEAWERDKDRFPDPKKAQEAKSGPPYRFLPHVIEPSAGADRFALAVLCEAYTEDQIPDEKGVPQTRVVMKIHPRLAPVKAAIFPLVKKDGMPEKAQALYRDLKKVFNVFYDDKGAVGRRYRRQDEAGTPYCVTIDGQTLQDDTVTIRDRDTTKQWRVAISQVSDQLRKKLAP